MRLFRSVPAPKYITEEQRSLARDIVQSYGHTPLARFTLFEDKSYFFSSGGSMIAYVLKGRTAITLGDPIGPTPDFMNCLNEFEGFCTRNYWVPTFYQVLPDHLDIYYAAGFKFICIGHDAIIDLSTFSLARSESKNIRNAYNKMVRRGYRIEVNDPPHPSHLIKELNQVSNEWLPERGGFEMGFSLGKLEKKYLNTCPIILVRDSEGRMEAFANLVFEFQADEASIDLMRYRPGSQNGQMDFLFVSALHWAKDRGIATFNLGYSPFIGIGEGPQAPFIEHVLRFIHERVIRVPRFKGLHFFKEKFNPFWAPRYLIYPGITSLPGIAIGIMRTYKVNRVIVGYLSNRK